MFLNLSSHQHESNLFHYCCCHRRRCCCSRLLVCYQTHLLSVRPHNYQACFSLIIFPRNKPRRCRRGRLRLVTDKLMGVQLNVNGDVGNTWRWYDFRVTTRPRGEPEACKVRSSAEAGGTKDVAGGTLSTTVGLEARGLNPAAAANRASLTPSIPPPMLVTPPSREELATGRAAKKTTPQQQQQQPQSSQSALLVAAIEGVSAVNTLAMEDGGETEVRELTSAPPIGVIAGKIDRNIGVKIVSQEKMSLSFHAENK